MKITKRQLKKLINEMMIMYGGEGTAPKFVYDFVAVHRPQQNSQTGTVDHKFTTYAGGMLKGSTDRFGKPMNNKVHIARGNADLFDGTTSDEMPRQEITELLAKIWQKGFRNIVDAEYIQVDERGIPCVPFDATTPLSETIQSYDDEGYYADSIYGNLDSAYSQDDHRHPDFKVAQFDDGGKFSIHNPGEIPDEDDDDDFYV